MPQAMNTRHIFRTKQSTKPTEEGPKPKSSILQKLRKKTGKTLRKIFQTGGHSEARPETIETAEDVSLPTVDNHVESAALAPPPLNGGSPGNLPQPEDNPAKAREELQSEHVEPAGEQDLPESNVRHLTPECLFSELKALEDAPTSTRFLENPPSTGTDHAEPGEPEQSPGGPTYTTPTKKAEDSGYNSPQDETRAWEKILEMSAREHEHDMAALKDEHDDIVKDLNVELARVTGTKEHLQKRVKKEILEKRECQRLLKELEEDQRFALEQAAVKEKEMEEEMEKVSSLQTRLEEVLNEHSEKEASHQAKMLVMEREAQELKRENAELKKALTASRTNALTRPSHPPGLPVPSQANLGIIGQAPGIPTTGESSCQPSAHDTFQQELRFADKAVEDLQVAAKSQEEQSEANERYHEQIRGQNFDLQKRVNECMDVVRDLKNKMSKAAQTAATDLEIVQNKLDEKTAMLTSLESSKTAWKIKLDEVFRMHTKRVTTDKLVKELGEYLELYIGDNEAMAQRGLLKEREVDDLHRQLRLAQWKHDELSDKLAAKDAEILGLEKKKQDLETVVLAHEMDQTADQRAEPRLQQAYEDVASMQAQLRDQAAAHAALVTDMAKNGPQGNMDYLNRIIGSLEAEVRDLRDILGNERQERYLDRCVAANHNYVLRAPGRDAEEYRKRAIEAEKVWDRVRELEQQIENDRVSRLQSDARTLEIRKGMEEDLAQKDAWISHHLDEIERLRGESPIEAQSEQDEAGSEGDAVREDPETGEPAPAERQEEVQRLMNMIDRLYVRVRRLEATLSGNGIDIEEFDDEEGDALKAECERQLGYDNPENTSETSESTPKEEAEREPEAREDDVVEASASVVGSDVTVRQGQANLVQNRDPANHAAPSERTLRMIGDFVAKVKAEPDRHRVLGEPTPPLTPATPPTPTF